MKTAEIADSRIGRDSEVAQKKWKRLKEFTLRKRVVNNVKFKDGVQRLGKSGRNGT